MNWLRKYILVGATLLVRGKSKRDDIARRQRRFSFGASTQRMGVRFGERVRDVWRGSWLRLRR